MPTDDIEWFPDPGEYPSGFGFSNPGQVHQGRRAISVPCMCVDVPHGHIHVFDEGLVGQMPFPCRSQDGVQGLLAYLEMVERGWTRERSNTILYSRGYKALPSDMTEEECAQLEDYEEMARLTRYVLIGN